MATMKEVLDRQREMFGCTIVEIDELVKYFTENFGNAKGLATSMLSDAQEFLEHTTLIGDKSYANKARQLINKAKYIIHEFTDAKKI